MLVASWVANLNAEATLNEGSLVAIANHRSRSEVRQHREKAWKQRTILAVLSWQPWNHYRGQHRRAEGFDVTEKWPTLDAGWVNLQTLKLFAWVEDPYTDTPNWRRDGGVDSREPLSKKTEGSSKPVGLRVRLLDKQLISIEPAKVWRLGLRMWRQRRLLDRHSLSPALTAWRVMKGSWRAVTGHVTPEQRWFPTRE